MKKRCPDSRPFWQLTDHPLQSTASPHPGIIFGMASVIQTPVEQACGCSKFPGRASLHTKLSGKVWLAKWLVRQLDLSCSLWPGIGHRPHGTFPPLGLKKKRISKISCFRIKGLHSLLPSKTDDLAMMDAPMVTPLFIWASCWRSQRPGLRTGLNVSLQNLHESSLTSERRGN